MQRAVRRYASQRRVFDNRRLLAQANTILSFPRLLPRDQRTRLQHDPRAQLSLCYIGFGSRYSRAWSAAAEQREGHHRGVRTHGSRRRAQGRGN